MFLNLKKIWHFLTCERYTELASRAIDQPLHGKDRFGFWLHHIICTFCRRSRRQMLLLEKGMERMVESDDSDAGREEKLSIEARERIRESLRHE